MLEDRRDKKGTNIYRTFFAIIVLGGKNHSFCEKGNFLSQEKTEKDGKALSWDRECCVLARNVGYQKRNSFSS